jgi:glucose/arabinose dehydrogenase
MKKFFIGLLLFLVLLVSGVIATPFLLIQFGSEYTATSVKVILSSLIGYAVDAPDQQKLADRLSLPEGFSYSIYAENLGKIRFLTFSQSGDLLVSKPRSGEILLLERDQSGDLLPDGQRVLLSGLTRPNSTALLDGWLYVAESNGVGRIQFDTQSGATRGDYERIVDGVGDSGGHWTKTIKAGPDGWLYLSIGSSCNVCEDEDKQRASIIRFKPDGSDLHIYATGLRNSVGMDFAPWDNSLYATDNGRDMLGDDFPPDELNRVIENGFYGWPYINGFGIPDPDLGQGFASQSLLDSAISPVHGFRPHNAPLGITFIDAKNLPDKYQKSALVALHGSWNRSERDGYKIVSLHWQDDDSIVEEDFFTGFLGENDILARLVDVVQGPDGAFYISDDYTGYIYRVAYREAFSPAPSYAQAESKSAEFNEAEQLEKYSTDEIKQLTQLGQETFKQFNCVNCHGKQNSLSGVSARYRLDKLADFFLAPTPPMPRLLLNDKQRVGLAVYLYLKD